METDHGDIVSSISTSDDSAKIPSASNQRMGYLFSHLFWQRPYRQPNILAVHAHSSQTFEMVAKPPRV